MQENEGEKGAVIADTGDHLYLLANRVISLIFFVIFTLLLIVVGLLVFYGVLLVDNAPSGASGQMRDLLLSFWGQLVPMVSRFASLVAPVFVLIFALGLLYRLASNGASPFALSKLLSDLPSALALLIIATICLLPLAGLSVPDVLNNIALVVVGFYFGKRKSGEDA